MEPELKARIDKYSSFLAEIRKRIFLTLLVFAVSSIAGFFFYEPIIKFLIDLLGVRAVNIVFTSPFQFINLAISCGVATGIVIVSPLIVAQILSFLRPALKGTEYKMVIRLLPFSIILFLVGFAFGALIMKWQIEIFLVRSVSLGIGNVLDISRLLTTVILTSVLMGVAFQFPIVLLILMKLEILSREQLSRKRLYVYVGSLIFAILLPPDSILADFLLSLPLIILFEATLAGSRLFKK